MENYLSENRIFTMINQEVHSAEYMGSHEVGAENNSNLNPKIHMFYCKINITFHFYL